MPLDEADKEWIGQQFERSHSMMTQRFESIMDQRFVLLKSEMDQQFVLLKSEMDQRFVLLKSEMDQRFVLLKSEMDQRAELARFELERVETSLLTAFHKWASPMDARVRSHTSNLRAIDLKLEELEDRIRQLETPHTPDDLSSAA